MKIKYLMSTALTTVNPDESLFEIKQIFDHYYFHHILVVSNNELMGVISDRDLLANLTPALGTAAETTKDLAVLNKKAHQIVTRKAFTLTEDDSLYDAIAVFNSKNVSCIPIVNQNNAPIGILTWRDILVHIEQRRNEKLNQSD